MPAEEQGGDFKAALKQMGITAEEIVQRISENGEEEAYKQIEEETKGSEILFS